MTKFMQPYLKQLLYIFAFVLFFIEASAQSNEDLAYLDLLPESQASSIAERLGVQTGKPIKDEIRMDAIDEPSFSSIELKSDIVSANETEINNIGIFGLSLFKDSPTTFAPIDLAPAPLDYIIGPGDELRVQL